MNLYEKTDYINKLLLDLKAEYLISCLFEDGVEPHYILAIFEGTLKRRWSRDISYAEVEEFENGEEALSIHQNRLGIYDSLPEALFHRFPENKNATGKEMAKESMIIKGEEKKARIFFRPFENEIFLQNVQIALNETRLFQSLYLDLLNGIIRDFWKIDDKIPHKYVSKLFKVLPFVHQIIGDYKLTAKCLEHILEEKVNIEYRNEDPNEDMVCEHGLNQFSLGESILGVNSIIGKKVTGFIGRLVFQVGPLKNTNPKDFFYDGPIAHLLDCFYDYFTPVELDIVTNLLLGDKQSKFILKRKTDPLISYLGLNTMI
ncbi:MAG: hypothetical protein JXR70_16810 [Spirochaetales bacterium]|nr:hypothetical protein [Spirochaetales bacterium]